LTINKIAPCRRNGRSDFHRGDSMTLVRVVNCNCLGWSLGMGHKVNGNWLLVCQQFKLLSPFYALERSLTFPRKSITPWRNCVQILNCARRMRVCSGEGLNCILPCCESNCEGFDLPYFCDFAEIKAHNQDVANLDCLN